MGGEPGRHAAEGLVSPAHSFGRVLRGRDLPGLSVEEVLMPRGVALDEHGHTQAQICFVLEGEYWETARGRAWRLAPGAIWFRPPGEIHANVVATDQDALTLLVSFASERFMRLERLHPDPCLLRGALLGELRSEMIGELRRGGAGAELALEGWALLLLSQSERVLGGAAGARARPDSAADAPPPGWLDDAVQLVEESYCNPISLATVASQIGVHPATLAAAFRRYRRISVGELIRELRLRHARRALSGSRAPIKQIAVDAGFYDQAHLGRCFKRRFGISPAALRRN
jgi:AraC family transcriptional regulator